MLFKQIGIKVLCNSWNLKILLAYLFKNSQTIGIDICGECANEVGQLNEIKRR